MADRRVSIAALLLVAGLLAGCSSGSSGGSPKPTQSAASPQPSASVSASAAKLVAKLRNAPTVNTFRVRLHSIGTSNGQTLKSEHDVAQYDLGADRYLASYHGQATYPPYSLVSIGKYEYVKRAGGSWVKIITPKPHPPEQPSSVLIPLVESAQVSAPTTIRSGGEALEVYQATESASDFYANENQSSPFTGTVTTTVYLRTNGQLVRATDAQTLETSSGPVKETTTRVYSAYGAKLNVRAPHPISRTIKVSITESPTAALSAALGVKAE